MFYLVRARLFFKGLKGFKFPKNYDDLLSSISINKINDFFDYESKFKDFHYFTFSNFVIEQFGQHDESLISLDGILTVVISTIDEGFLRKFISFLVDGNNLYFENNVLSLIKFEFFENPIFDSDGSNFITISPILLKNFPDDGDLFSFLENLLVNDYCEYYNLDKPNVYCQISSHRDNFQKFIDFNTASNFNDYYYMSDLYIIGDERLISFAYDVGLGNNTNKGFGMLDFY